MREAIMENKGLDPEEVEKCQDELEELKEKYGDEVYSVAVLFGKD